MLAQEKSLYLIKNNFQVGPWRWQLAELVALLRAPVKLALWEATVPNVVRANSNKIVALDS